MITGNFLLDFLLYFATFRFANSEFATNHPDWSVLSFLVGYYVLTRSARARRRHWLSWWLVADAVVTVGTVFLAYRLRQDKFRRQENAREWEKTQRERARRDEENENASEQARRRQQDEEAEQRRNRREKTRQGWREYDKERKRRRSRQEYGTNGGEGNYADDNNERYRDPDQTPENMDKCQAQFCPKCEDKRCTEQEFRRCYHSLALLYHPDKAKDSATLQRNNDITKELNKCKDQLWPASSA